MDFTKSKIILRPFLYVLYLVVLLLINSFLLIRHYEMQSSIKDLLDSHLWECIKSNVTKYYKLAYFTIFFMTVAIIIFFVILFHALKKKNLSICGGVIFIGIIFQFLNTLRFVYHTYLMQQYLNGQAKEISPTLMREMYAPCIVQNIFNLFIYIFVCLQIRQYTREGFYYIAIHEAGHAVISSVTMPNRKIEKIYIKAFCGHVEYSSCKVNLKDAYSWISVCYAGKTAVERLLETKSIGDELDLKDAHYTAKEILKITKKDNRGVLAENKSSKEICENAYNITKELVDLHKGKIIELANLLVKEKELSAQDIECILVKN